MSRNRFDLRFGVRRADGYTSSVWRLWVTRHSDVYLAVRSMAAIEKYSFHRSGICHYAFTKEYGCPDTMQDRTSFRWKRNPTPTAAKQVSRVAWIAFPTDFLSRDVAVGRKEVTWIDAAPTGEATWLELGFSFAPESTVKALLAAGQSRRLLKYFSLPRRDDALLVTYYYSGWDNHDLTSPTTDESAFPDLLFSAEDPDDTGRPIRIVLGRRPKDGDALIRVELGGFAHPAP